MKHYTILSEFIIQTKESGYYNCVTDKLVKKGETVQSLGMGTRVIFPFANNAREEVHETHAIENKFYGRLVS